MIENTLIFLSGSLSSSMQMSIPVGKSYSWSVFPQFNKQSLWLLLNLVFFADVSNFNIFILLLLGRSQKLNWESEIETQSKIV